MSNYELINGECLEEMRKLPPASIDCIICDPPYGILKGRMNKENTGDDVQWDNIIPIDKLFKECGRVLRQNGRLILFSMETYTSKLILYVDSNFQFNYRMNWLKNHFANALTAKKAPVSYIEDICVFTKVYASEKEDKIFQLYEYGNKTIPKFTGVSKAEIQRSVSGCRLRHFMGGFSQFGLPSRESYEIITKKYNLESMPEFISYDDMVKMNCPKPVFNLPEGAKTFSNVLTHKKTTGGFHPTQKPISLMEDLVKIFTNPKQKVLDFAMGSGSTGIACLNLDRQFVGIELDKGYYDKTVKRFKDWKGPSPT